MLKIGIITYHCAYNYGAVLQAYALQTKLNLQGFNTELIDFRPSSIVDGYKEQVMTNSKRAILYKIIRRKNFLHSQNIRKKRYAAFDDFIVKQIKLSKEKFSTTTELQENTLDYDIYICGSDQIWNSRFNGNEHAYFLSFVKDGSLKIAYAPSFGVEKISEAECQIIKPLLSNFIALSTREEHGVKLLNGQLKLEATHVLDPTLLLEREQWMEMSSSNTPMIKQRYVFLYIIGAPDIVLKKINLFVKSSNIKLIFVGIGPLLQPTRTPYIDMSDVGPTAFINLLINADYVCTNSFHGLALSILFNKKFAIIFNKSLNSRMESLLKMCKMESQLYDPTIKLQKEQFENINFEFANSVIKEEKEKSLKFLINAIKGKN